LTDVDLTIFRKAYLLIQFLIKTVRRYNADEDCLLCRLDQTLGKPGSWAVNGDSKEKQKTTVAARLSRIETQVSMCCLSEMFSFVRCI